MLDRILVYGGPAYIPDVAQSVQPVGFGVYSVILKPDVTVEQAILAYQQLPGMGFVEPDYIVTAEEVPNDPSFDSQWGLENSQLPVSGLNADINAPFAWDGGTGTGATIVAVIDTGVDYTHPDLAANIWTNPGEVANDGIDNDGNGYVDDFNGWDFVNDDNDPMDDHGHGTHAAGTIGAVGNNAIGIAGVNWHAKIMPIKFMSGDGRASTSNAIRALSYAISKGARVSNNSWGGTNYSAALALAIDASQSVGHLFVAAAGNRSTDLDTTPNYPAAYTSPNIITVAASDRLDNLGSFSNYGKVAVDLAAPGVSITSTYKAGQYATLSGTSMAAPFVAGAAALLMDQNPGWNFQTVSQALMLSVDVRDGLIDKVASNGRLNLGKALRYDPDGFGPKITDANFGEPSSGYLDRLTLTFDKGIDPFSFDANDVYIAGPGGQVNVTEVEVQGELAYVSFVRQFAYGHYTATIGPDVRDYGGRAMDQNGNWENGDPTDTFSTSAELVDRSGPVIKTSSFGLNVGVRSLVVNFSEDVQSSTFGPEDVTVTGPNGAVPVLSVVAITGRQYEIFFAEQTKAGTYTVKVGPNVADLVGNLMDQSSDGVGGQSNDVYTTSMVLPPPTTRPYLSTDGVVSILDQARLVSHLVINEDVRVTDINIRISARHTAVGDLRLWLVSPDGTAVMLMNRRGGSLDNLNNTTFDDESTRLVSTSTNPTTGTFRPESSLSVFDGKLAKGTWRLIVDDTSARDFGRLLGWTMTMASIPVTLSKPSVHVTTKSGTSPTTTATKTIVPVVRIPVDRPSIVFAEQKTTTRPVVWASFTTPISDSQ